VNIVQQTFHGMRIKVTYKCGHVKTELSMTDAETKERRRIASSINCHCCVHKVTLQKEKICADPITIQLSMRRKEVLTRLEQRFGQLRTR
jgi:hypothetical protein